MTTPERLRRRQRFEGTALLLLGIFTIAVSLYFRHEDARQRECFTSYVTQSSQVQQVRSSLVERESQANRKVIVKALSAQSIKDIALARDEYQAALKKIDAARDANPVEPFSEASCTH